MALFGLRREVHGIIVGHVSSDEYSKAADSFKRAASAYSKAYGATDRRVEEARKRAKLMNDKLGIADDTPAPAGGIRPSGSRIAVK
jgi:hypothetical protein